jgi:hypothetical protein
MRLLTLPLLFVLLPHFASAGSLPDTTIVFCYDATGINTSGVEEDNGAFPRQDCRYGFDPAALRGTYTKIGAGEAGLDYTALDAAGNVTTPPGHSCVRDNITGLVWENETSTAGLFYGGYYYTWYNSDVTTNGFGAGTPSGGNCFNSGRCDTEKYVADVNAARLCGFNDWRMPSVRELLTITNQGQLHGGQQSGSSGIDLTFFPNSNSTYWTATPSARILSSAWRVNFDGSPLPQLLGKNTGEYVRLVRGANF